MELQDELARVIKAKAKQAEILQRYTQELETSRRRKKRLKKVRPIGRNGGRSWDVWVVQVCCELLVNGTPLLELSTRRYMGRNLMSCHV